MKTARWITGVGSFVLVVSGVLHGTQFMRLSQRITEGGIKPPLDGILKASWLIFSVEMVALGVIAFLASKKERGGGTVLLCAATSLVNGLLLWLFVGLFVGVYLTGAVALLLLIGGLTQAEQSA